VGPAARWDTQAAFQFISLVSLGMRGHHRLCDVGCGSLRAGRLFIPYLGPGCYYGIEPETWLLDEGRELHVGRDLEAQRSPQFIAGRRDFPVAAFGVYFDYVLAQSILTHADQEQVQEFLGNAAQALAPGGCIVANWQESLSGCDFEGRGWQYPSCVPYTEAFMRRAGEEAGLKLWRHRVAAADLICSWGVWKK
jgi:SAM-dependent methyltransferase